jgi:hypothetical protein
MTSPSRKSTPSEASEQESLVAWLRTRLDPNAERLDFFHTPNGGKRDMTTARALKRQGLSPGVPDIIIITPPPNIPGSKGCFLELKRQDGNMGQVSAAQRKWLSRARHHGYEAVVAFGWRHAKTQLEALGY